MRWLSLERVWKMSGSKKLCKVRFSDWNHEIKFFAIMGMSTDGKRIVGTLDSGERISFPKRSRGWELYSEGDEVALAQAV